MCFHLQWQSMAICEVARGLTKVRSSPQSGSDLFNLSSSHFDPKRTMRDANAAHSLRRVRDTREATRVPVSVSPQAARDAAVLD